MPKPFKRVSHDKPDIYRTKRLRRIEREEEEENITSAMTPVSSCATGSLGLKNRCILFMINTNVIYNQKKTRNRFFFLIYRK